MLTQLALILFASWLATTAYAFPSLYDSPNGAVSLTDTQTGTVSIDIDLELDNDQQSSSYPLTAITSTYLSPSATTSIPWAGSPASRVWGHVTSSITHYVNVGRDSQLLFDPIQVNASIGDTIVFQFHRLNHTVTESSLDEPCVRKMGGFDSGFTHFNPNDTNGETAAFSIDTTDSRWFFCAQYGPPAHCKAGMVFAINPGVDMNQFLDTAVLGSVSAASSLLATPTGVSTTLSTTTDAASTTSGSPTAADDTVTVTVTTTSETSSSTGSEVIFTSPQTPTSGLLSTSSDAATSSSGFSLSSSFSSSSTASMSVADPTTSILTQIGVPSVSPGLTSVPVLPSSDFGSMSSSELPATASNTVVVLASSSTTPLSNSNSDASVSTTSSTVSVFTISSITSVSTASPTVLESTSSSTISASTSSPAASTSASIPSTNSMPAVSQVQSSSSTSALVVLPMGTPSTTTSIQIPSTVANARANTSDVNLGPFSGDAGHKLSAKSNSLISLVFSLALLV